MARELVRDPNTGKPALQVINYEVVEVETLQQAVTDAQAEYDAAQLAANEANERLSQAETGLNESKSELEAGQAIAAESGVESGEEADGGTDQAENPDEAPSFAQAV